MKIGETLIQFHCTRCNADSYDSFTKISTYHYIECPKCKYFVCLNNWPTTIKNFKTIGVIESLSVSIKNRNEPITISEGNPCE